MGQGFWVAFPRRHRLSLPLWKTQWGRSPGGTGYSCRCGARGGACLFGYLSPLPLAYLSAPYPPDPLPRRGRGRPKLFYARGSAPCIPATEPGRHLQNQPSGCPTGGCILPRLLCLPYQCFPAPYPPNPLPQRGRGRPKLFHARGFAPCIPGAEPMVRRKTDRKRFPMSRAGSQGEGGPGEMELSVASDGGV